jgi:hypothetical protein
LVDAPYVDDDPVYLVVVVLERPACITRALRSP